MGAAAIVEFAGIVIVQLAQRVVDVNVVGAVSRVSQKLNVLPGVLVGPVNGL